MAARRERVDAFLDRLQIFATNPILAWAMIIGNLVAVWYGWTDYYAGQLDATPKKYWIFVPDSPNAVFLFALCLLLRQIKVRAAWLDLLAWVENVKVGLWTVFVLLYYFDAFFRDQPGLRWTLFVLHVGMIGQSLALHRDLRTRPPSLIVFGLVFGWLLVGDWLDYGPVDLHPYLRGTPPFTAVTIVTVGLSFAVTLWAFAWYRPRRSPAT